MLSPNQLKLPDTTNCATGCLQINDRYAESMTHMQKICKKNDKYVLKHDKFMQYIYEICIEHVQKYEINL